MKKWFSILGISLLLCVGLVCTTRYILLFLSNWKFTLHELNYLGKVDRIELVALIPEQLSGQRILKTHLLKVIDDPQQIELIVNKIQIYADDWEPAEFGALSPLRGPIQIFFFYGERQQTVIEIGYNNTSFFIKQPLGPGRYLSEQEFNEIIDTLGIDRQLGYYEPVPE